MSMVCSETASLTNTRQPMRRTRGLNEAATARVKRAAQQADQTVHAHPYTAMGMAAAVGLLVGYLAARR